MACINPDGTLTPAAKQVLETAQTPASDAELAKVAGLPVYRVRSTLRELLEAGLLVKQEGQYQITDAGRQSLAEQ